MFFYYYCCSFLLKVFNWGNYFLSTCDLPKNTLLTCLLKIGIYSLEIISICLLLSTFVKNKDKFVFLLHFYISLRDSNGEMWGQRMGSSSPPHMVLFCPIPAPPHMIEKTFSPHPHPLEPCKGLSHLIKLYFLLICLTTSTIFFLIKTYFVNKNILEITTKFILSNQINF